MITYIGATYPKADTSEGSLLSDIVIQAPSQEIAKMYEQDQRTSDNQALATANDDGLSVHGSNLNTPKIPAIAAKGIETFFSYSAPASDITIPAGTLVGTGVGPGTTQVQFRTVRTVVMFAVVASSYLNSATGLYEIQTDIECTTPGIIGVVGAQNINSIINPIGGIDGCYNGAPTDSGADTEDTELYRQRLALKWQGNSIATDNGLLSLILAQPSVEDAIIIGHGLSPRNEFGAIDIYVKGVLSSQYIDSFSIDINSPQQYYITAKQPLITSGVQTIIYGASGSVVAPAYTIATDSSVYGGSVMSADEIVWASPLPAQLGTVYITYTYNSLIETLQNLFSSSASDVANASILVKWAKVISIDVTATIKVSPGYDSLNVTFDIQDALALFFDGLKIGAQVQQADVVRVILNTPGVDDVRLPLDLFRSTDGTVLPDSFGDLNIPSSSYAVGGTIIINIVT